MPDKTHLEEFIGGVTDELPKRLVQVFAECSCDAAMKPADIITRLKEKMEEALPDEHAAD
jgi:hypothetical protein